jgi:hypothetical protein
LLRLPAIGLVLVAACSHAEVPQVQAEAHETRAVPAALPWEQVKAAVEARMLAEAGRHDKRLVDLREWPDPFDLAAARKHFGDPSIAADESTLSRCREIAARHHAELDPVGSAYFDLLDHAIDSVWRAGRFDAVDTSDPAGRAQLAEIPTGTFVTRLIQYGGWSVRFQIHEDEFPEVVDLDRMVADIVYARDNEIARVLGARTGIVPADLEASGNPPHDASSAQAGSSSR